MKKLSIAVIALAILTTQSCLPETGSTSPKVEAVQVEPPQPDTTAKTVILIVLADITQSNVENSVPDPTLFEPVCTKITKTCTLDHRYGLIRDYSNTTLDRYYAPFVPQILATEKNVWEQTGEQPAPVTQPSNKGADWNQFISNVHARLSAPPSKASDIGSAIRHALVAFNENHNSGTRKILFLCTDYEDSYGNLPSIPSDVEVISVGMLRSGKSVNDLLQYNGTVHSFENVHAAIQYLYSQNF